VPTPVPVFALPANMAFLHRNRASKAPVQPDHQTLVALQGGLLKVAMLRKWMIFVWKRQSCEYLHLNVQTGFSRFFSFLLFITGIHVHAQHNGEVKCSEAATYSIEGILTTDSDKLPIMELDEEESLRPGDKGEMHKQFETQIFKSKVSGWMSIGIVEVVSVKGKTVKFKVIEYTADININGEKRNQFRKDTRVKFSKYEYGVPVQDTLHYPNGAMKATGTKICDVREGMWKDYDDSGRVRAQYMMRDGRMNGSYESYLANGNLVSKGEYADDKKTGDWITYHVNGRTASFATYVNGNPMGKYTSWYDNSQIESEINYSVTGQKEGALYEWHFNGKPAAKFNYKDGRPDGVQEVYYDNGILADRSEYSVGVQIGKQESWYQNGKRKSSTSRNGDGKLHGLVEEWTENGTKLSQGNYINGVPAGESKHWYPNGNLQDSGYYNSKGNKEGTWMYYYENGKPKEMISYSDATLHGPYATYYENGQVKVRGAYYFKLEDGKWEEFYETGKKKSVGEFLKGKKIKTWYYWDEQGEKRKEKHI
jgi:antitoxin component YwqK of YwqJK toxin-antitoxin module